MTIEKILEQQKITDRNTSAELAHCFSSMWLSEIALQLAITNRHIKRFYNFVKEEEKKNVNCE